MEEFRMILAKVAEIVSSELSVSIEDITMDTHLQNDLNTDSLDAVELIMSVEEEFDMQISDEEAQALKTVGDIVRYIENNK
jgi:acyl carrier protein